MAKIHPHPSPASEESSPEIFTIWMKSLVFHGNGCTVFNSKGEVAFRVDNYQQRCSRKTFLMDSTGNLLFSLTRNIFGCWQGFKWIDSNMRMEKPCFEVRRNGSIFRKDTCCHVTLGCDENRYTVTGFEGKSTLRITDISGQILAEATEKLSAEGIPLGEDVLRLVVEENADQSLVMALIIVHALINRKL